MRRGVPLLCSSSAASASIRSSMPCERLLSKRKASAMAFLASRSACRMTWRVKAVQSGLFEMAEVLGISLRMVSPKGSSSA